MRVQNDSIGKIKAGNSGFRIIRESQVSMLVGMVVVMFMGMGGFKLFGFLCNKPRYLFSLLLNA